MMVPMPGLAPVLQEPHLAASLPLPLPPLPPSLAALVPSPPVSSTPLDRRQIATCIGNLVALALSLIGALEKLFYEFDVKHPLAPSSTNGQRRTDSPDDHDEEERLRSAAVLARVELLQNGLVTVDEHIRQLLRDLTFVDDDLNRKIELVRERAASAR